MKKKSKISVSLVLHNEYKYISRLANSIKKQTHKPYEIYVTDNNSIDGSPELIKEFFPDAYINAWGKNPGYGTAHNYNMKKAFTNGADAVFIVNTDTELSDNCLEALNEFMLHHPDTGIISPLILYGYGEEKSSIIQNFKVNADLKTGKIFNIDNNKDYKKTSLPEFNFMNYFSGTACMLTKESFSSIGGFPEPNFFYGEEMDCSYRAYIKGFKVASVRDAKVWHFHNWSKKNLKGFYREYYYINRNRVVYFKKFNLKKGFFRFISVELLTLPYRLWWAYQKGGRKLIYYYYLGIIHGFRNKSGIYPELLDVPENNVSSK